MISARVLTTCLAVRLPSCYSPNAAMPALSRYAAVSFLFFLAITLYNVMLIYVEVAMIQRIVTFYGAGWPNPFAEPLCYA
jgi:hypothetical protein